MNATQAKQLTQESLAGEAIDPYMDQIFDRIKETALKGSNWISNPLYNMRISSNQKEGIYLALRNLGYKVKHHPDPDPRDPRSHAYETISW